MNPMFQAMQGMRQEAPVESGDPTMSNPAASNANGDVIFLDKNLQDYEGKCKKGEKVSISGTVESVGDKIGIRPDSFSKVSEEVSDEYSGIDAEEDGEI